MKHILSRVLLAAGLLLVAGDALAQASQTVNISAAVVKSCAATAKTDISVAAYDPNAAAATTADGSVTVLCTKGTTYNWIVNDGLQASATSRRLASTLGPTEYLSYDFLATSDGATWTNASIGMAAPVVGAKSTGRALPMTLGLRVSLPANQDVSTELGNYTDQVLVTVAVAP